MKLIWAFLLFSSIATAELHLRGHDERGLKPECFKPNQKCVNAEECCAGSDGSTYVCCKVQGPGKVPQEEVKRCMEEPCNDE